MKNLSLRYYNLLQEQSYLSNLVLGLLLLAASFVINNHASLYATQIAGQAVPDLFLDNLDLQDVSFLHIYAALSFWLIFTLYVFVFRPETLPFISKTASVFILIRSGFICLTHIGAPVNNLTIPTFSSFFIYNGDLFFSGHVGGPFLLALIFWNERFSRYLYLLTSLFFGYIVLAGHIHYSIDVAAAPFITYGVFHFAKYFFALDYGYFNSSIHTS
ncbi:phosphatase PAP2-related protein [Legionella sp. km772]|uniref:phosphatase PAP2-related protein n=1 Tax=Legionella sp. km772 TaxID=2498111 RepID=UPI000F8E001D|nr:phosphatase PAP2-related protein [Legionella sp. km772]RUR11150.1 hypothetical protein ELY15_07305 [Legionella sp. km772]